MQQQSEDPAHFSTEAIPTDTQAYVKLTHAYAEVTTKYEVTPLPGLADNNVGPDSRVVWKGPTTLSEGWAWDATTTAAPHRLEFPFQRLTHAYSSTGRPTVADFVVSPGGFVSGPLVVALFLSLLVLAHVVAAPFICRSRNWGNCGEQPGLSPISLSHVRWLINTSILCTVASLLAVCPDMRNEPCPKESCMALNYALYANWCLLSAQGLAPLVSFSRPVYAKFWLVAFAWLTLIVIVGVNLLQQVKEDICSVEHLVSIAESYVWQNLWASLVVFASSGICLFLSLRAAILRWSKVNAGSQEKPSQEEGYSDTLGGVSITSDALPNQMADPSQQNTTVHIDTMTFGQLPNQVGPSEQDHGDNSRPERHARSAGGGMRRHVSFESPLSPSNKRAQTANMDSRRPMSSAVAGQVFDVIFEVPSPVNMSIKGDGSQNIDSKPPDTGLCTRLGCKQG